MHRHNSQILLTLAMFIIALLPAYATSKGNIPNSNAIYLIVNEDLGYPLQNAIEVYLAQGSQITLQAEISTGGYGIQGGYFGTSRLAAVPSVSASCVYVSDAGSNDVAGFSLQTQQFAGTFPASQTDNGGANGIGLAMNTNYLYASFTTSNTIATYALRGNCSLSFLGDVPALGLNGGSITGMATNDKLLVVAYGDDSIQSFNVSGGTPVANNDLQNSTASANGTGGVAIFPTAVDLTQDGKFALFGDIAPSTIIEVSSLGTGKLSRTSVYPVGTKSDAGTIRLSPDQSLLYITNNEFGTVTAAFFDSQTGTLRKGCVSAPLYGFNGRPWYGSVVARDTTGTGNLLYVAEYGRDQAEINHGPASAIGMLAVTSDGTTCTLTETNTSPVLLTFPGTLSLGVYPPRPF